MIYALSMEYTATNKPMEIPFDNFAIGFAFIITLFSAMHFSTFSHRLDTFINVKESITCMPKVCLAPP